MREQRLACGFIFEGSTHVAVAVGAAGKYAFCRTGDSIERLAIFRGVVETQNRPFVDVTALGAEIVDRRGDEYDRDVTLIAEQMPSY